MQVKRAKRNKQKMIKDDMHTKHDLGREGCSGSSPSKHDIPSERREETTRKQRGGGGGEERKQEERAFQTYSKSSSRSSKRAWVCMPCIRRPSSQVWMYILNCARNITSLKAVEKSLRRSYDLEWRPRSSNWQWLYETISRTIFTANLTVIAWTVSEIIENLLFSRVRSVWPWMKVKGNISNTWCIPMSEAVTMPSLTMMTSMVSKESLARWIHTHTYTHSHTGLVYVKFCLSRLQLWKEQKKTPKMKAERFRALVKQAGRGMRQPAYLHGGGWQFWGRPLSGVMEGEGFRWPPPPPHSTLALYPSPFSPGDADNVVVVVVEEGLGRDGVRGGGGRCDLPTSERVVAFCQTMQTS